MLQCCSVCYREPCCEVSASTSASSKPMSASKTHVSEQVSLVLAFKKSKQDRCQVKLGSSPIEAMAERYMESPESPAFFTVGAANETATASSKFSIWSWCKFSFSPGTVSQNHLNPSTPGIDLIPLPWRSVKNPLIAVVSKQSRFESPTTTP